MQQTRLSVQLKAEELKVFWGHSPEFAQTPPFPSQSDKPLSKPEVFPVNITNNIIKTIRAITAPIIIHHMLASAFREVNILI